MASGHADKYTRRSARNSYLSTVVSISLVLFMLGVMGWVLLNANRIKDHVKENVLIEIFLEEGLNKVDVQQFKKKLDAEPYVKNIVFVSKDSAAARFQRAYGEDFMEMLEYNPLPASMELHLYADYAHNDSIVIIEQGIFNEHKELISDVKYRKDYLAQLNDNIENITLGLLVMCGLLLVIAIALINNTIRLSIYSKRFLIKSMQLVGATQGFIRRPFLLSGVLQGLYGGALAIGLLQGLFYLSVNYIPDLFELQDAVTLGILFGGMGLMGILITWFSTLFSMQKYLRLKSDELY